MKIKILIDEDVHASLAEALRKRGYDAVNVNEINKRGFKDNDIILEAIKNDRCLFTFNVKDFVILHKKMIEDGKDHPGIIVSKQLTFSDTLKRILKILQSNSPGSLKNRLEFL